MTRWGFLAVSVLVVASGPNVVATDTDGTSGIGPGCTGEHLAGGFTQARIESMKQ